MVSLTGSALWTVGCSFREAAKGMFLSPPPSVSARSCCCRGVNGGGIAFGAFSCRNVQFLSLACSRKAAFGNTFQRAFGCGRCRLYLPVAGFVCTVGGTGPGNGACRGAIRSGHTGTDGRIAVSAVRMARIMCSVRPRRRRFGKVCGAGGGRAVSGLALLLSVEYGASDCHARSGGGEVSFAEHVPARYCGAVVR